MMRHWLTALVVLLLAAPGCSEQQSELKTKQDKESYGIGVGMARNFKQQGIEINSELVLRGLKDELSGKKLLMSDEELRTIMTAFQTELRQKQVQARQKAVVENKKEGEAFLAENKAKEGVVTLPSGLQYKVLKAGEGKKPTENDTVEVIYRGTLTNGTEFDSSHGKPATFKVTGVVPGWKEALQLMPAGSKWQLFIPPDLAYGERGAGPVIGPNATLIFEVELLSVK